MSEKPDIDDLDAFIFDMDGVVTDTASVHGAAWKRLFDEYLRERSSRTGEPFVPFDQANDYHRYVDGRNRYDGVASFLESRGITLPFGSEDDPVDAETVLALGRRKDAYFKEHLKEHGAEPYESTVQLIRDLKDRGICSAIVTAVLEDAQSGVEAGRRGKFGLVVGVDRVGQADALGEAGADVVVSDLGELKLGSR